MDIKLNYENISTNIVNNDFTKSSKISNNFQSYVEQMNPFISSPDEFKYINNAFTNAPYNVRKAWTNVFNSLPKEDKLDAAIISLKLYQIKCGEIKSININNYTDDINGYINLFNTLSERLQNDKYDDIQTQITHKKESSIIDKFINELRKYN